MKVKVRKFRGCGNEWWFASCPDRDCPPHRGFYTSVRWWLAFRWAILHAEWHQREAEEAKQRVNIDRVHR